jgi:hypothetical protein
MKYHVMLFDEQLTRVWLPAGKLHRFKDVTRRTTPSRHTTAMKKAMVQTASEAAATPIDKRRLKYCYVSMAPEFKDIALTRADHELVFEDGKAVVCLEQSVAIYNCDPNPMDFSIHSDMSSVHYGAEVNDEGGILNLSGVSEGLTLFSIHYQQT